MTTLHMETDNVRALAGQLKQAAESMRNQTQSLNGSAQGIDWQGPSSDEFVAEIAGLIRQLNAQIEAGAVLVGRVESEVAEWEQMSNGDFQSIFTDISQISSQISANNLVISAGVIPVVSVFGSQMMPVNYQMSNTDLFIDPRDDPLYQQAVKNIGEHHKNENDQHYQWRVDQEILFLEFYKNKYKNNSMFPDAMQWPSPADWWVKVFDKEWHDAIGVWKNDHPEPS